jgi:hypothetical protein
MKFKFEIEVEVERTTGKFVSKDDIRAGIESALTDADPGTMTVGDNSEYETTSWEVSEV